jgi:hypothetical protein
MGIMSILAMVAMCLYHRLVARKQDGHPIAPFKMWSYITLKIPPAMYGVLLACIPVMMVALQITIVINGRFMSTDVFMF